MPHLHEILTAKRDEILRCYADQVARILAPSVVSREDILDHMPPFLDNAIAELEQRVRHPGGGERIAVKHGVQRFELGFDIDALVRDYGILRQCISDALEEALEQVSVREYRVLTDFLIEGIALAVSAYIEQRDAAQRQASQKHFAFLAHELRNQLSSVSLAVGVLDKRGDLPEIKATKLLHRGLARVHDMVNGALIEASLEAGVVAQREHIVLVELLREACEESVIDAESRGINVSVEAAESLTIEADPRLLHSAVTNLFRNAVKFSRPGGRVILRGGLRAEGGVFIEVEDTCGGLATGAQARIFAPFEQASTDRSGFGLGLAITRQAVEVQGGCVTVRDLPGRGCIFALDFPRP
jgi:signal transduction histidine kinase